MRGGSVFKPMASFKEKINAKFKKSLLPIAILFPMLCWVSAAHAMEDPTRPPTAKATSSYVDVKKNKGPRWTLRSTLVSSDRRTAVVNARVVRQGDRSMGATGVSMQLF